MFLTIHRILVNLGTEGALHEASGSRKLHHHAPLADAIHLETLGGEPCGNGLDVLVRRAELLPELFRRKPLMEVGRGTILLVIQQATQSGFLIRTALQDQHYSLHGQRGRRCAAIVLRDRKRVRVTTEPGQPALVDRLGDPGLNGKSLSKACGNECDDEKEERGTRAQK